MRTSKLSRKNIVALCFSVVLVICLFFTEQGYSLQMGLIDLDTKTYSFIQSEQNISSSYPNPIDINNSGQIVGTFDDSGSARQAFLWEPVIGFSTLGTLGGTWSAAHGINDSGQIVGESDLGNNSYHAFSWTEDGGMIDLGSLSSSSAALDINNNGEIVGSYCCSIKNGRGFYYSDSQGMIDIGTLGETDNNTWAMSINNLGEVVGASSPTTYPDAIH